MSKMYVSEYAELGAYAGMASPVAMEPPITEYIVSFTGTPGLSAAFNPATRYVRIHVDGLAAIKFGTAPVAAVDTNKRLVLGQTEYFAVPGGASFKVSAITVS